MTDDQQEPERDLPKPADLVDTTTRGPGALPFVIVLVAVVVFVLVVL